MTLNLSKTSRIRRIGITLLVLLLPVAAWSLWDYVEARRLSAAVKQIQSRGEPIVSGAADGRHPWPMPQHSAGVYYEAAAILTDRVGLAEIEKPLRHNLGDRAATIARLRSWLEENRAAEELLERAANVEFKGFRLQEHLRWDRLWVISSLARARVIERLEARDADGAALALLRQWQVGRAMSSTTMEWLPFSTYRTLAELSPVLDQGPSAAVLERLQQAIRAQDRDSVLHDDALNARALLIESLWSASSDWYGRPTGRFGSNPLEPLGYLLARPWMAHRVNAEVRRMNTAVARSTLAWPDRLQVAPVPMPDMAASRWRFLDSPAHIIAFLHQQRAVAYGRMLAQMRTAEATIAVERYRQAHESALPPSLDALVPAFIDRVPVDPFSGAPIRLKVSESGYAVYSFGSNFKDDGGTALKGPGSPGTTAMEQLAGAPDIGFAESTRPDAPPR
jgi:hypothetical protein